jgi:hypothetical protein
VYAISDIDGLEYDAILVASIDETIIENIQKIDLKGKKVFFL